MSIIYDALQKTQTNRSRQPATVKNTWLSLPWFNISMMLTIIILLSFIIYAYYPTIKNRSNKPHLRTAQTHLVQPAAVIPVIKQPSLPLKLLPTVFATGSAGKITLNGVFLSDHDKFAMINNQTLHIGDSVEGMKVISIELDQVHLRDEKTNLILRATA